ncbi:MAG TPA: guanine deaminase [Candidatus Obscuribacterales bacterium]
MSPVGSNSYKKERLTAYLGHIVNPLSDSLYEEWLDGALIVDGNGRIVDVGAWAALKKTYAAVDEIYDYERRLIFPGFVDLHIHLPQVTQVGKSGDTLLGWLEKYIFPAESRFSEPQHARQIANWFFDELPRNGTTLAVVFTTIHEEAADIAFEVAAHKGNRVVMGKVMMDRHSPPSLSEELSQSLKSSAKLAERWHGYDDNRIQYAFTPRFAITSSDDMLRETGKLWRNYPGTFVHTHLAESKEEVRSVAELFPRSRSYLDVYDQAGLVGERSVFAHAIHIDDTDLAVLSRSKSALAYCPSSNFFLKSGIFPIARVKDKGVQFGLGSDVAAGPSMCLFGVMKDANFIQPEIWISPAELLYYATIGGARALKLDHKVGSLERGKEADFVIVNPNNRSAVPGNILNHPTDEILSVLVFMGDDRMIEGTYVRGKAIYEREDSPAKKTLQKKPALQ